MKSKRVIQFIKAMQGHGIKKEAAEEILSLWDEREGELATKADLEQVEKRLEAGIKGNRWAIAIAISAIGLVFTAIITGSIFFWGQISDMQANIQKLLQGQQKEQQAERTGNSARSAQEGRISAADHSARL